MSLPLRIMIVLTVSLSISAAGQRVSDEQLKEMAHYFMNENFPGGARKIASIVSYDSLNTLKIFQLEPEGWLLVSTDRKIEPVIGFSFTGHFMIPAEDLYNPMQNFFRSYHRQIRQILNDRSIKAQKAWDSGKSLSKGSAAAVRVQPFMQVNWGQGAGYNRFCPSDASGPGGHVYTGCVAVSMAQAMSVYHLPMKGTGYHSYIDLKYGTQYVNFGNAIYLWDSMSVSAPDKYNAMMLYHCAVSTDMNFGADGSGTQTLNAAAAMRNYFGFSHNILHKSRTGTVQEWHDNINGELLKGRPVIYAGDADDGKPGHAFNIDGVMNAYYHINWGWTGSSNGYFTLDALNPASNNFNKNQSAIFGIQPFYYPTDILLSDTIVKEDLPAGTFVGKVQVIDEATDNTYTLKLVSDSVYNGSSWIRNFYLDGDIVRTGRMFSASDNRKDTIIISLEDRFKNKITRSIPLNIGSIAISTGPEYRISKSGIFVYPNPAEDIIYLTGNLNGLKKIIIYSLSGSKLKELVSPAFDKGLTVAFLHKGYYIIEANFSDHTVLRQKFIKK